MRPRKKSDRRVLRGGSSYLSEGALLVSYRLGYEPVLRLQFGGFRLVIRKKA